MEAKALRELLAAMASGKFAPAYYIHGGDEFRKDDLLRSLASVVVEPAMRDFNLDTFRGAEVNPEQVESLLNTPPMMATRRGVIVRDTGSLKKDARATLERYLQRPSPDSVLLLVALAGTKEEKPFSDLAVDVPVEPLSGSELTTWLVAHAREVHGAELRPDAVAALLEAVGADTVQLAAEVDKLVSYASGAPITTEAVAAVVGVREGESLGVLLDAVAARDLPRALAVVEPVLLHPKVNAVNVIMALTVQTLALSWGVHARHRGLPAHSLQNEYFSLLKQTGAFPMRSWGEATRAWAKYVPKWDRTSVTHALKALRMADLGAKDTRISSDEQLLSNLLCAMCAAPAPSPAR
jgi:DNA polymerase-3 subunit delta